MRSLQSRSPFVIALLFHGWLVENKLIIIARTVSWGLQAATFGVTAILLSMPTRREKAVVQSMGKEILIRISYAKIFANEMVGFCYFFSNTSDWKRIGK